MYILSPNDCGLLFLISLTTFETLIFEEAHHWSVGNPKIKQRSSSSPRDFALIFPPNIGLDA